MDLLLEDALSHILSGGYLLSHGHCPLVVRGQEDRSSIEQSQHTGSLFCPFLRHSVVVVVPVGLEILLTVALLV